MRVSVCRGVKAKVEAEAPSLPPPPPPLPCLLYHSSNNVNRPGKGGGNEGEKERDRLTSSLGGAVPLATLSSRVLSEIMIVGGAGFGVLMDRGACTSRLSCGLYEPSESSVTSAIWVMVRARCDVIGVFE